MFDVLVVSGVISGQTGDVITLENGDTEQGGTNISLGNDDMNGQTIIIDDPGLGELVVENTNTLIN